MPKGFRDHFFDAGVNPVAEPDDGGVLRSVGDCARGRGFGAEVKVGIETRRAQL
jgi:hypothetical protein